MQSPVTNEDAIVAVAAVEDTVPGGDSQPAVAVDSSDLGTVSPAPVPFVPTLGAWAKPLKLSPSALSVQRKFGSNLLQDLSYPTSHWPSLPSGQREGHTKNMATPVPNKGPMVTVAGGDSQPVVAVDSPDLRSTVFSPVSPASVPLVRTYSRSLGKTPEDPSAFFFFWVGRTMGRWFEPTPRSVRHVPVAIFLFRSTWSHQEHIHGGYKQLRFNISLIELAFILGSLTSSKPIMIINYQRVYIFNFLLKIKPNMNQYGSIDL